MATITQHYYDGSALIRLKDLPNIPWDHPTLGVVGMIIQELVMGSLPVATEDIIRSLDRLVDNAKIREYSTELADGILEVRNTVLGTRKQCSVEASPITRNQDILIDLIREYSVLVITSHNLSGHGKSWEPYVGIVMETGVITQVNVRSYQAGDNESFTGSEKSILRQFLGHIEEVKPLLLSGRTYSNPLVHIMTEEQTVDNSEQEYQKTWSAWEHDARNLLVSGGCFLPALASRNRRVEIGIARLDSAYIDLETRFPAVQDGAALLAAGLL